MGAIVTRGGVASPRPPDRTHGSGALPLAEIALLGAWHADHHGITGEPKLARAIGGSVERRLPGRERISVARDDHDGEAVVVPDDVVRELGHGTTLLFRPPMECNPEQ